MKNRIFLTNLLLALVYVMGGTQPAHASDIPILTWEQGKLQSVVLGGGEDRSAWEVELVSSSGAVTKLKSSSRNQENFVVFSVVIPRDLPLGTYTLFTRGLTDENTRVAVVNLVEATSYELGRVPGDLIYLFIVFIGAFSFFVSLTGRRFSYTYLSSVAPRERFINGEPAEEFIQGVHNLGRWERLRISVQQNSSHGTLGDLVKANSSILHFRSRQIWASFPLILSGLALFLAVESPSKFVYLFLLLCLLGNMDIFAGFIASIVFVSVATFNTEEFSFSIILGFVFLACLFFLPSIFLSVLSILFGDQAKRFDWAKIAIAAILVHFLVLMQRSLLPESYLSTPEELLVLVSIILAIVICQLLEIKKGDGGNRNLPLEEVNLEVSIAPSRSALIFYSFGLFSVIYAWSMKINLSLLTTLLALLPLLICRIRLDRLKGIVRIHLPRKPILEVISVCILTYIVFVGLTRLPLVTYSILESLFVAGFAPVIIYAFYVLIAAHCRPKVRSEAI
jgi:hypothetical protein